MTTEPITLAAFWDMCKAHDWHYTKAEGSPYHKGARTAGRIGEIARQRKGEFLAMLHAFSAHHLPQRGQPQGELPPRPTEGA